VMCFEPGAPFFPFGGVEGFHRRMISGLRKCQLGCALAIFWDVSMPERC
jgi:hypothetical protein